MPAATDSFPYFFHSRTPPPLQSSLRLPQPYFHNNDNHPREEKQIDEFSSSNGGDGKRKKLPKQIEEFAEKTSCHGIKRVFDRNTLNNWLCWKNIIWLLLTLVSFGMAVRSLVEIFTDYNSHPVSTLLKSEFMDVMEFPSVTFCNLNPFVPERAPNLYGPLEKLWDAVGVDKLSNEEKMELLVSGFDAHPAHLQRKGGHTLEEMLISCSFQEEPCTPDDFFWFHDRRFGMCYSFNFGLNTNGNRVPIRTIAFTKKFVLKLDCRSDLYLKETEDVGFQLVIHDPGSQPDLVKLGFKLAPGFSSTVGISLRKKISAGPPYAACLNLREHSNESKRLNMYESKGYSYSRTLCRKSCVQAYVIQHCGCCDKNIPCNPDGFDEIFGVRLPKNGTQPSFCNGYSYCLGIVKSLSSVEIDCTNKCPSKCEVKWYEYKHSQALWPNRMQTEEIFDRINGNARLDNDRPINRNTTFSHGDKTQFVRENVLALEVFSMSRTAKLEVTQPTYAWNTLLSNVGGQLGLWLGFSLLTAFEILECVLDCGIHGIKSIWKCATSTRRNTKQ